MDLLGRVEEDQPASDGQKRQEELARYGQYEGYHQERCHHSLEHGPGTRRAYDAQTEDAEDGQGEVLKVVEGPLVLPQGADGVSGRKGGLQAEDVGGRRLADAQSCCCCPPSPADFVRDEDAQVRGARKARRGWHVVSVGEVEEKGLFHGRRGKGRVIGAIGAHQRRVGKATEGVGGGDCELREA